MIVISSIRLPRPGGSPGQVKFSEMIGREPIDKVGDIAVGLPHGVDHEPLVCLGSDGQIE